MDPECPRTSTGTLGSELLLLHHKETSSPLYALEASESVLFRVINVIAQGRPDMETTSLA